MEAMHIYNIAADTSVQNVAGHYRACQQHVRYDDRRVPLLPLDVLLEDDEAAQSIEEGLLQDLQSVLLMSQAMVFVEPAGES